MRHNDRRTLRALSLDDRRKPRESAAALPVRHHLIRHLIDVIHQDQGDMGGAGKPRTGENKRGSHDEAGEISSNGHGLDWIGFALGWPRA